MLGLVYPTISHIFLDNIFLFNNFRWQILWGLNFLARCGTVISCLFHFSGSRRTRSFGHSILRSVRGYLLWIFIYIKRVVTPAVGVTHPNSKFINWLLRYCKPSIQWNNQPGDYIELNINWIIIAIHLRINNKLNTDKWISNLISTKALFQTHPMRGKRAGICLLLLARIKWKWSLIALNSKCNFVNIKNEYWLWW